MKYLILVLALAASVAHAADTWLDVAKAPHVLYSFKRGSCRLGTNSIACLERQANDTTHTSVFTMSGTSKSACAEGYGQLVTLNLAGDVLARNDVVSGGGTIAAEEFDVLCLILAASTGTST